MLRHYELTPRVAGPVIAILASLLAGACAGSDLPSEASTKSSLVADEPRFSAETTNGPRKIALLDDCLPTDAWNGGCTLKGGTVSLAQFQAAAPLGHPAWRNEPSYMKISDGKDVRITNEGGRPHTFTRVAAYGGGILPPLNRPGQVVAPECANVATRLASLLVGGASMEIEGLEPGNHKFMCCFHPWMIAEVRVL
jgi:plastocyanin